MERIVSDLPYLIRRLTRNYFPPNFGDRSSELQRFMDFLSEFYNGSLDEDRETDHLGTSVEL